MKYGIQPMPPSDSAILMSGNSLMTRDHSRSAAAAQMKDEVYEIFLWEGAEFEFGTDYLPREFSAASSRRKIRLKTYSFLLEAVRRITEWEEVRKIIPKDDLVLAFPSTDAKLKAITTKGEKDLLLLVDGRHPIADLVRIPELLCDRGYSPADLEGIRSNNFLKLLRSALPE